jgi:hypothetical protein
MAPGVRFITIPISAGAKPAHESFLVISFLSSG